MFSAMTLTGADALAAPKLKVDSTHFDFGFTPEGLPVIHRYWAYNVGTDTLKINRVRPSCGCTTVPLTKKELAPGDSVSLELKFDTKRFKGQIAKTAAIDSNDPDHPETQLHFSARVGLWEGIVVAKPNQVYLDTLGSNEKMVTLKNTSIADYKISIVSPMAEFMTMELSSTTLPGKGEVSLSIRTTPKTPIGEYNASVTLHLDGPEPHNLSIPVYGIGFIQ
jgi:hypothetical protein